MKKRFLLCLLLSFSLQTFAQRKVQLVILFDTSNSMDGLLNQAKARIWAIVNETSNLRHNGLVPTIEIEFTKFERFSRCPLTSIAIGGAARSFKETGQSESSGVRMNAPALVISERTSSPVI
jgi:hypothetical protein